MNHPNVSRRNFLKYIGAGAAALAAAPRGSFAATPKDRPNIILIMADDMGYSDIGCYGSEISTPNIDRLAMNGLRFSHFYNAARCCPTRASLMTGLYPHQAGMGGMVGSNRPKGPYQGYLNDQCVTIAEVLKDAGYTTLMSGKWHVGEERPHWPTDRGFDKYYGLISGAANYFDITQGKAKGIKRGFAIDDQPHRPDPETFYMTRNITDYAVDYVREYGTQDKPFFMYVAYTAPHWPLHALPEDIAKYEGKYLGGWDQLREQRYKRIIDMGLLNKKCPLTPRDKDVQPWEDVKNKEEMAQKMAVYAAQIDRMDQGIGRILEAVKASGKEENTLVLFLSDNGGCHEGGPQGFDNRKNGVPVGGVDSYMSYGMSWANASNTPFRLYKHWVHEGGCSTPLVAYWPSVIKNGGAITHQVGHIIDIMATCCEVSGAAYPEKRNGKDIVPLEGKSLLPILEGKEREGHDVLYWEHSGNRAVRKGTWKLVSVRDGKWELYDLEADRSELNDLSEENPEKRAELLSLYDAWAARCGVEKTGKKKG